MQLTGMLVIQSNIAEGYVNMQYTSLSNPTMLYKKGDLINCC